MRHCPICFPDWLALTLWRYRLRKPRATDCHDHARAVLANDAEDVLASPDIAVVHRTTPYQRICLVERFAKLDDNRVFRVGTVIDTKESFLMSKN